MRALQFFGKEDVRLRTVDIPAISPEQVRVRPAFVGICGTDVHEYARGATLIPQEAHALTNRSIPITLGHEISGVVDGVGQGVKDIQVGDHVAILPIISDDTCYACRQGHPNCCDKQGLYGLSTDGGLADYMVVSASNARKLPPGITLDIAALVEPLSVGWHAVQCCVTSETTSALVMGAGPIGLCVMQALKARNISTIIAVDTNLARKDVATLAGAHHFINPLTEDVPSFAARICQDSSGVHVAFDTAGKQATLDQCVAALCARGTVVNIAIWGGPATILPNAFLLKEKRYLGTAVYTREDFDAVIQAIASGIIDPGFMITSRIPLADVVSRGILKLLHDPGSDLKILVDLGIL
ncbi:chaperonin 10-like protein [Leptodontidium sp. MPI-SDFR-AT-0119]|nr:chaperonin 10-like protein [Leptodontidium sp. MPI-SDFR-AT-0119]